MLPWKTPKFSALIFFLHIILPMLTVISRNGFWNKLPISCLELCGGHQQVDFQAKFCVVKTRGSNQTVFVLNPCSSTYSVTLRKFPSLQKPPFPLANELVVRAKWRHIGSIQASDWQARGVLKITNCKGTNRLGLGRGTFSCFCASCCLPGFSLDFEISKEWLFKGYKCNAILLFTVFA